MKETRCGVHGTETILVAEDESSVRRLIQVMLESNGYTVLLSVDGEDALAQFSANRDAVRLLVLDVIMPKKSGKAVCTEIKKMKPTIHSIFMSGYSEDMLRERNMIDEHAAFISKPMLHKSLLMAVRAALDNARANTVA
jgi:DNA-binding NtrC family response regulator